MLTTTIVALDSDGECRYCITYGGRCLAEGTAPDPHWPLTLARSLAEAAERVSRRTLL